jgi:hypothetical protein
MRKFLLLLLIIEVLFFGCKTANEFGNEDTYISLSNENNRLGIVRKPPVADFSFINPDLKELPRYTGKTANAFEVDVRSTDLTGIDLRDRSQDLLHASFDSKTIWPSILPADFNPELIMEMGKNPGLGIRDIHREGITGKNIGLAIIDQALLVDHSEYINQLRFYEEIHNINRHSSMHGPALASIAVGRTVGVAPDAELYYIAETDSTFTKNKVKYDLSYLAQSIRRICEINATLDNDRKIRVISISLGINPKMKNSEMVMEAIEEAKKQNIYVLFVGSENFRGMFRSPLADPDDFNAYRPGTFWGNSFYESIDRFNDTIMVPMDSRCTASPTGQTDYAFYSTGGMSWAVPYVAGLYALACQVHPKITPEVFWQIARSTAKTILIQRDGKNFDFGKIINPSAFFIELMKLT